MPLSEPQPPTAPGPVVTIGNFDGVHRGHQALLDVTIEHARALGVPAWALTFDPAPRDVLRPDNPVPRIQSLSERLRCLRRYGLDEVVVEPFTLALSRQPARWFAEHFLAQRLGASAIVVGWDFRFGAGRSGGVEDLRQWLQLPVTQVQAQHDVSGVISSSRVRQALREGDLPHATGMLGRPHRLVGEVVAGDARGRQLGFPTANVAVCSGMLPPSGVYAVRAKAQGRWWPAVANLGTRPTFDGRGLLLEVHLLDFSADIYGQELAVALIAQLRGERRFDTIQALQDQIHRDIAQARRVLR